jgi:vacuolar-type H+-ATPase subunit E/Vma4
MANKTGKKADDLEFESRMSRVFEMMLYDHLSYREFASAAAKEFKISERQAENLWKEARVRLKERYQQNHEEILENHLNQLYDLLKRCREERNKRVEREVLADIAKIHSLEGTKKVDITSNGNTISLNILLDKD